MGRVVLVTGVCRGTGGRFARSIAADPDVDLVVGVDVVSPPHELGDVQFVLADIRTPTVAAIIAANSVDTVVHLSVIATPSGAGGRTAMKEINVTATMQLLAACQRASAVERLVVKSSTHVYGSSPSDPALFGEDMEPRQLPRAGVGKDCVEVEGYVRGFARRRPDVAVTVLRCADLIGPEIETTLTRYLELPVIPTVLGFDPRLQLLHEDDALAVLRHSVLGAVPGTFNVAGDGVLMLSQAVRRLGRPSVALPSGALGALGSLFAPARQADLSPEQIAFLTYGRGVDTTMMQEVLGFQPSFTTARAFDDFARRSSADPLVDNPLGTLQEHVGAWLTKVAADGRR